jgi:hypothetical protein
MKFGRLEVVSFNKIKNGKSYWNCICECGQIVVVNGSSLRMNLTKSCGCIRKEKTHENRFKDLTGKNFCKLKVVSFNKIEKGRSFWNCICDCGQKNYCYGK